jgi:DNA repair exonuclease SbcCD nuclease subunit
MNITLNKSKVAIISDLHLGIHSNSSFWHEIAINWAKWLKEELNNKKITDIIFCGDWHHNRSEISVSTLQVSADILDIFKDFNLIAITGNHDIYFKHRTDVNSLSIFKNRKNVTIFDSVYTLEAFDRTITFCPWNTAMQDIPKSDVIFGHFEIVSFKMNTFKYCEEGFNIQDLLYKAPVVISGHFHYRHEKQYDSGTILYAGNPFQMDFGDAGNTKGYHVLDLDTLQYEFIENKVSPLYERVYLSELVKEGSFTDKIKKIFDKNIVKLKVDQNICQDDMNILIKKLHLLSPQALTVDYDINFNRILDDNKEKQDLSGIDIEQAIIEFTNLLDIKNKEAIINYTIDLYRKCKE